MPDRLQARKGLEGDSRRDTVFAAETKTAEAINNVWRQAIGYIRGRRAGANFVSYPL